MDVFEFEAPADPGPVVGGFGVLESVEKYFHVGRANVGEGDRVTALQKNGCYGIKYI